MVPPGRVGGPRGTGEPPKELGIEEKKGEVSIGSPGSDSVPIIPVGPDPAHILPPEGFRILKILGDSIDDSIPVYRTIEVGDPAQPIASPPPPEAVLEMGLRKSLGIAEEGWFQEVAERPEGVDPFGITFSIEPLRYGRRVFGALWDLTGLRPDQADSTGSHFFFDFRSHLGDPLPLRMTLGQARQSGIPVRGGLLDVAARPQFVFRRKGLSPDEGFNPYVREASLALGDPWLRALRHTDQAAVSSFRGLTDKYGENQDRLAVVVLDDGRIVMAVIDGMGGHGGGERAAEIAREAASSAWRDGYSLEESINRSHEAVVRDNAKNGGDGGATFAGLMERPDGTLEVRCVGDSEALVIALPEAEGVAPEIVYWSTRPAKHQEGFVSLLPDGRIPLGQEGVLRLDLNSNIVDTSIGGSFGTPVRQSVDVVPLPPGKKYGALLMTDGLAEQFKSHQEIVDVIHRSGAKTPQEMRDAVMREALIRCSLARMQRQAQEAYQQKTRRYVDPVPMELTPERYAQAYREMTEELYGQASDPPPGFRGMYEGHSITNDGYVVHPDVAATFKPDAFGFDPVAADPRLIVGRFKEDNITLGVAHFQR